MSDEQQPDKKEPVFANRYFDSPYRALRDLRESSGWSGWGDALPAEPEKSWYEQGPPCSTCAYLGWNPIRAIFSLQACKRPGRPIDPVTGEPEETFASNQRRFDCGPNGRFHSDFKETP